MSALPRIVLASSSPRRRELLAAMGVPFEVVTSDVDERTIPADHPRTFAIRAAYAKAHDVAQRIEGGTLVLGADTVVTHRQVLYGKPESREHARRMLQALAGEVHQVVTGIALVRAGDAGEARLDSATTEVRFRPLTPTTIAEYLDRAAYSDKAGAYGIQEPEGEGLVEAISGDYFNVVGFPCTLVADLLHEVAPELNAAVPEVPKRWRG